MWKIAIGFVIFAAIALFVLKQAGGDVDMGGEKHSVEAPHPAPGATAGAPAAPSASMPASAAAK